jgi:hypothetical protein
VTGVPYLTYAMAGASTSSFIYSQADRRSRYGRLMSLATNRKRLFTRIQEWLQQFALRASKPRRLRERTCSTAFKLGPAAVDLTTPGGCRGERNCDMPPGLDAIIRTRPLGFWRQAKFGSLERHLSPRSRV